LERFFLQPLIPALPISELLFEKRYKSIPAANQLSQPNQPVNSINQSSQSTIQPVNDFYQYNTGYRASKRKDFWGWLRKPKGSGGPLPFGLVKLGSFFIRLRISPSAVAGS
jgi:hypothetical protein